MKLEKDKQIEDKFSKEQLLTSDKFRDRRDILNVLLLSGETYTVNSVEEMIENYMKGQVN